MLNNSDEAEDCVQETFKRYYERLLEKKPIMNHKAYVLKIAKNICIDKLNQKAKNKNKIIDFVDLNNTYASMTIEDQLELSNVENNIDAIVKKIINSLSADEKELYEDYYIVHFSIDQIACRRKTSSYAVKNQLSILKTNIEKLIKDSILESGDKKSVR